MKTTLTRLVCIGLFTPVMAFAQFTGPKLSMTEAAAIALNEVPDGRITDAELDMNTVRGTSTIRWEYSFEIVDGNGKVDVELDGDSGSIREVDYDSDYNNSDDNDSDDNDSDDNDSDDNDSDDNDSDDNDSDDNIVNSTGRYNCRGLYGNHDLYVDHGPNSYHTRYVKHDSFGCHIR